MSFQFDQFKQTVQSGGGISAKDVVALRRWSWSDGIMSDAEAAALFELNSLAKTNDPEWADFFVEALTDYALSRSDPKGYVNDPDARWILGQIDKDGRVDSATELELLVKLSEKAIDVPQELKSYALDQIEKTVLSGEGVTHESHEPACMINASEAALLRRLLFASSSDGPVQVSQQEAEMLFRLKDACIANENAPAWKTLFVQGVGNFLMGYCSYQTLTRERAQELERFMNDTRFSFSKFVGSMFNFEALRAHFSKDKERDYSAEFAAAEAVTAD
jgi:hypothetical protein